MHQSSNNDNNMKVYIGKTFRTGKGVFAAKDMKSGEHIFTFSGNIIRDRIYNRKLKCTLQVGGGNG